ncbi:MAG: DUF4097 family beta strand repeat protein [Proteobacteria bacterium]|nr:DUF4097 family beta strand repeat protein [Pseudomonadota bacterium]
MGAYFYSIKVPSERNVAPPNPLGESGLKAVDFSAQLGALTQRDGKVMVMRLMAAVLVALGAVSNASAEEYSKSYVVTGRPQVHVHVDDSSVHVIASDTQNVEFNVKRAGSSVALNLGGGLKIESHQDGDRVELTVLHKPGIALGFNDKRLVTEVRMPREGNLRVESVDGSITVDSLTGDVQLHSTDGAVTIAHFDGRCDASSTDGSLRAQGRFDALNLQTTDGSVVAKIADGSKMSSPWSIRSVDGSLEVSLPRDFQANIHATTVDGSIKLGLPVTVQGDVSKSEVNGALNGGGQELTLATTDGSIRLN